MNIKTISDFRPDEIIMNYWAQVLSIEEDAQIYSVEYWEGGMP